MHEPRNLWLLWLSPPPPPPTGTGPRSGSPERTPSHRPSVSFGPRSSPRPVSYSYCSIRARRANRLTVSPHQSIRVWYMEMDVVPAAVLWIARSGGISGPPRCC
jgi:hypothetical protein